MLNRLVSTAISLNLLYSIDSWLGIEPLTSWFIDDHSITEPQLFQNEFLNKEYSDN